MDKRSASTRLLFLIFIIKVRGRLRIVCRHIHLFKGCTLRISFGYFCEKVDFPGFISWLPVCYKEMAKTLSQKLSETIANFEQSTGYKILTTEAVNKALALPAEGQS